VLESNGNRPKNSSLDDYFTGGQLHLSKRHHPNTRQTHSPGPNMTNLTPLLSVHAMRRPSATHVSPRSP
jgi:hypothetical protein